MLLILMLDHQKEGSEGLGTEFARKTFMSQQEMIPILFRVVEFGPTFHARIGELLRRRGS